MAAAEGLEVFNAKPWHIGRLVPAMRDYLDEAARAPEQPVPTAPLVKFVLGDDVELVDTRSTVSL